MNAEATIWLQTGQGVCRLAAGVLQVRTGGPRFVRLGAAGSGVEAVEPFVATCSQRREVADALR